jgi:acyl-CoA-binding protein
MENEDVFPTSWQAATSYVASLAANNSLDQSHALRFYGLYKHATEGPAHNRYTPGFFDFAAKKKWNAWQAVGHKLPRVAAAQQYIDLLSALRPDWHAASSSNKTRSGIGGPVFSTLAHEEDVDVEEAQHEGSSSSLPLIAAARSGDCEQVRKLLEAGVDANQRDSEGCTPLHWAADRGHLNVVHLLLADRKVDVDATDEDGLTPLMYCCLSEHRDVAESLVTNGANIELIASDGLAAIDLAPASWTTMF